MSVTATTGLLLGLALGGSILLLVAAAMGWKPKPRTRHTAKRQASLLFGNHARRRALVAAAVGLLVAVVTRWPVAAGATMAVIYLWPTMFGGARVAAGQIERIEALASWTESLRDSIAGSVGLEEAIKHSLHAAPPVLKPALQRLEGRLRVQIPLPHALASYAEEFEDSSADLVVAALILNSRLRGPGLVATLSALATAAREEIDMRRRIEEGRTSLRRTAMIIVAATALFAGGLTLLSRDYVAPYSTPFGQVMLAIVLSVFAGGLMWIRSAANIRPPERFLVGVDQIDAALQPAPSMLSARGGAR
jgi:tight adherence protein B